MKVIKRSGKREEISYDKITKRVEALCHNVEPNLDMRYIDPSSVTREVVGGIFSGISTESLDTLTADICASKIMEHPDYNKLAARITISNLHKKTKDWTDVSVVAEMLYRHVDKAGKNVPMINEKTYRVMCDNAAKLNSVIDFNRDYRSDFFSIKTLERAYLRRIKNRDPSLMKNIIKLPEKSKNDNAKINHEIDILRKEFNDMLEKGIVIERPQHMWMRVAVGIHGKDIEKVIETYDLLSLGFFTHATPTLFNSGSDYGNLSSCFLLGMEDSVRGIFKTLSDCGEISKRAGGIGVHISGVRAAGSEIRTTNGQSNGIIPFCKLLNDTALAINQGGKRPGSVAVYLETHHADIFEFCELRLRTGTELNRARDLFLALWVSDLFMRRVENGEEWSLFCPDECPGLNTCHGEEYERLYLQYESNPALVRKRIPAQKLWFHILECQIETGMPYMAFKDNANNKNNQQNLGTIRSSNLCCEIFEYSDEKEYATCNLASISLPAFVERDEKGETRFNYEKLVHVARVATRNLNKIIDINFYPVPETKISNDRHRPIGVGVQGLADVFALFGVSFYSDEAQELNVKIFETIYYGCLLESVELAKIDGPYSTFVGSPFSEGKLQYDLWGLTESDLLTDWDWLGLKRDIAKFGIRNSLLTALMPTASTSQILCNNECFEPFTTNLYTRATSAGDYIILNKYLVDDLIRLDLWDEEMREELLFFGGSVQRIDRIPSKIRQRYLTSFELPQRSIIDLSVDRGPFIDQSQSLNIFIPEPDFDRLTSCHFHAWEGGLKTGMYYLRSRPAVDPIKFGLDPESAKRIKNKYGLNMTEKVKNETGAEYQPCEMCSA